MKSTNRDGSVDDFASPNICVGGGNLGRRDRVRAVAQGRVGAVPMQMPASIDVLSNPALGDQFRRWWKTPNVDAVLRQKLYKLAWDLTGSEFAGRHQLWHRRRLQISPARLKPVWSDSAY